MHIRTVRCDIVFSLPIDHEIDWPLSDSGGLLLNVEWNLRHLWATAKRHAAKLFVAANKNDKIV